MDKILGLVRPANFLPKRRTLLDVMKDWPNLGDSIIEGMRQAEERYGIVGMCTQGTCKEIQIHFHGPECHFTCYCEKGTCCYDSRE